MEKFNSTFRAFGLLVILTSGMTLSGCTKKQEQPQRDTTQVSGEAETHTPAPGYEKGERWSEVREKVNKEEKELNSEMRELETKASSAKATLKKDVHKTTEDIKAERDKLKADSLNPEFSNRWDSFISKTKSTLDSLKNKL